MATPRDEHRKSDRKEETRAERDRISNDFSLSRFARFCQRNLSSSEIFCRDLFFFRPPMPLPQTVTRRSIAKKLFQSCPRLNHYFANMISRHA